MSPIILNDCLNDVYSFESVISAFSELLESPDPVVDMSRVSFITPYSAVGLLLLGKTQLKKTGTRIRLTKISDSVLAYLERMDFLKKGIFLVDQELSEANKFKRSVSSRSVIEVTDIPGKESESVRIISGVVSLFRKRAGNIFRSAMSESEQICSKERSVTIESCTA